MIARCSRVGIPVCLKGIFVIFYPKIHVSPCDYFWLHITIATLGVAAALAAKWKNEEPKEESDDDMGFSLFD